MARIDAHQHFWYFDERQEDWITDEMSVIKRDFLPADLWPVLQQHGLDGCVAVQVNQDEAENDFFLELSRQNPFIKGVVGWIDLCSEDITDRLAKYKDQPLLKGFRHILQGERDRALMLRDDFRFGLAALGKAGFTYDLLILPDQLGYASRIAAAHPDLKFIVDHLAKPPIREGLLEPWNIAIRKLAANPNVYAKVSGLVTEAHWNRWTLADLSPFLDCVTEAFGPERLVFGSDWPVCLVAGSYTQMIDATGEYFSRFSADEKQGIFGDNAVRFYNL